MKTIDINNQINVSIIIYPDKQPHVNISDINEGDEVKVICSIRNTDLLLNILQVANAIDNRFAKKKLLVIPYLMSARFDRIMQDGDSLDLKIISQLINSCNFEKVILLDAHSDTSTVLINNSVNISNKFLVDEYTIKESILICPDAGAVKKVSKYLEWNKNIVDVVYCNKSRDLSNGNITLKVLETERCTNRNCVIIDDLCDGGGTFLGIASQIKPANLSLIITHGVFSKGIEVFNGIFNEIIVSDSYCECENDLIKVIKNKL